MDDAVTKAVDLQDEVARLEDEIEDVLEKAEELDEDTEAFEDADADFKAYSIERDKFEEYAEELDSTEFTIRELSFGELMHIRDEVLAVSSESPREGLYRVKIMETAVENSPDGMSDDPKDWPPTIAEWVYDEIDQMNTGMDEENLSQYSLKEKMSQ